MNCNKLISSYSTTQHFWNCLASISRWDSCSWALKGHLVSLEPCWLLSKHPMAYICPHTNRLSCTNTHLSLRVHSLPSPDQGSSLSYPNCNNSNSPIHFQNILYMLYSWNNLKLKTETFNCIVYIYVWAQNPLNIYLHFWYACCTKVHL